MRLAPKGAIYVLPTMQMFKYAEELATLLNRLDLKFASVSHMTPRMVNGRQLRKSQIVVDHAVYRMSPKVDVDQLLTVIKGLPG